MDLGSIDPVDSLSLRLQAISAGGWANIQTPVREAFEASATTVRRYVQLRSLLLRRCIPLMFAVEGVFFVYRAVGL